MDNENDPPIEPVQQRPVIQNQTPRILSEAANDVVLFLEKYGWFVILGLITVVFVWSKLEPYWRMWQKKREKRIEEEYADPVRLASRHESLEMSRRRMQEKLDAQAAEHAEKLKQLEEKKRQEKIDDWKRHQQGRGYRSKNKQNLDENTQEEDKVKGKKSGRLRGSDYSPLSGGSSGSSFRPASRRNTEGKRHDSGMLACSGLLDDLEQHAFSSTGQALCIYGDPAYPLRLHLQSPV